MSFKTCDKNGNNIFNSLDKDINEIKSFKNYDFDDNQDVSFCLKSLLYANENIIKKMDKNFINHYMKNLQSSALDFMVQPSKFNFLLYSKNNYEILPKKCFKEIELFLNLKMDFPLKISLKDVYKNFYNQTWDEILNSRSYNVIMNTNFNFNNFFEKEQNINESKTPNLEQDKLLIKNSKKRFLENDINPKYEKKTKKNDFFIPENIQKKE